MVSAKSGIAVGKNAGHVTAKRVTKAKPVTRKGKLGQKTRFVKELIREVAGFAPYERRIMELLKNGNDKRARKLAKRRLGTFTRGKAKVEELNTVITESRRAAH